MLLGSFRRASRVIPSLKLPETSESRQTNIFCNIWITVRKRLFKFHANYILRHISIVYPILLQCRMLGILLYYRLINVL